MRKGGILSVIAVVSAIGLWSVVREDSTSNVEQQIGFPIAVVADDDSDRSRDQSGSMRGTLAPPSQEELDAPATTAVIDDPGLSVWSEEPEAMAVSLLDELALITDFDPVSIHSYECTATACTLELGMVSVEDRFEIYDRLKPFEQRMRDPPYNAAEVEIGGRLTDGIWVASIFLKRNPWPFATAEEFLETRSESLRNMQESSPAMFASFDASVRRRFLGEADELLSSSSYDAAPVSFRGYFDERVIVADVDFVHEPSPKVKISPSNKLTVLSFH